MKKRQEFELDFDSLVPVSRMPNESMIVPARTLPTQAPEARPFVDVLVDRLVGLGVTHAFGIFGGGIAPFCDALYRSPIELLHFRHETGAAFAALEASFASGRPVVVLATTGPGMTNMLTGMYAARWEGAKVIFVSGYTPASQRGRWSFQETSSYAPSLPNLFVSGSLFHYAAVVEDASELEIVSARLSSGVKRPNGFVAHLGLPNTVQTARVTSGANEPLRALSIPASDEATVKRCTTMLANEPFVIWAGFGARQAAAQVRELAERSGAQVMCSPRGKGIMPEDHAQFLGVTGLGGHARIESYMRHARPAHTLVLGTRLGEFTSFYAPELAPTRSFIHVDLDAEIFGTAYPQAETIGVQAEIGGFLDALLRNWPRDVAQMAVETVRPTPATMLPREQKLVRPSYLMQEIQRVVVDGSDALVISEAGNALGLGSHYLRFRDPYRYRLSVGFASMGHGSAGVIGAALGRGGKAVAIVGDGALMMQNEIHTAATYDVDAVWIVLNDSRYGMIAQGMQSIGWEPFETDFPRIDFVAVAGALGVAAAVVRHERDVEVALREAMKRRGPYVIDVWIEPEEIVPSGRRNQNLSKQGVGR